MYPIGETKLLQIRGEPDVVEVHIKPPPGFEWLPSFIYAFHSNVANTNGQWLVHNGDYPEIENVGEKVTGTYEKNWFLSGQGYVLQQMLPLRLTETLWLRFAVTLEAGKYIQVGGVVLERPANLELTLCEWAAHLVEKPLPAGLDTLKYRIEHYRGGI